jgi:hypothetical protein
VAQDTANVVEPAKPEETDRAAPEQRVPWEAEKKKLPTSAIVAACAAVLLVIIVISLASAGKKCGVSGCDNTKLSGGDYCSTHTCIENGCYRQQSYDSLYCFEHKPSTSYYSTGTSGYFGVSETAATALKISGVKVTSNSSYTICTGTIKNNGEQSYDFVKVKGAFTTSTGTVVDTDWTYAVGAEGLDPGESTTFRMSVTKDGRIKSCDVTLMD